MTCDGRIAYATHAEADKALRALLGRRSRNVKNRGARLSSSQRIAVYRCEKCTAWHLGEQLR